MLKEHTHPLGTFDPGHCRICAREAGLLGYFWRVQREEGDLRTASARAVDAGRRATWALWLSGTTALIVALVLSLPLLAD